jgi:cobalt/nickel transport system permease protein
VNGQVRHAADHAHLHVPGDTPVHRIPPHIKLVGLVVFVTAVALTPRHAVGAFAADAVVLLAAVVAARLPVRVVVVRLAVIVPFLVFAVLVPFIAGGDQVDVLGMSLSRDGLWAAWNVTAKAVLGATASIVLAATTPVPDVIRGLNRLRVPAVLVGIVAFMFRYLDLLVDQTRRMRNAMVSRGHDPRWLWQVGPIAASAGTLFVRSYERGERVHHAMAARGYTGTMPDLDDSGRAVATGNVGWWVLASIPASVAVVALVIALAVGR